MRLSVVICTHNRAAVLGETLASFSALDIPPSTEVELIVVDNRSVDGTRDVVARYISDCIVDCRYIFEPSLGLSNARNRGIAEAKGDLIAFVDDDIYFHGMWLVEMVRVFERFPDAVCVSGAVVAHYEAGRPDWLDPDPVWLNMEGMFSITSFGERSRYLEPHETPVGANIAFRRHLLNDLGGFSGVLGRHGKVLLSKEESELFFRINKAGMRSVCAPESIVHHRIPPERTTKQWITRRFYWQGISQVVFDQLTDPRTRSSLFSSAFSDIRRLKSFLIGNSWSPMRVYWHVRGYRFYHRAFAVYLFALIRKRISMAVFGGRRVQ